MAIFPGGSGSKLRVRTGHGKKTPTSTPKPSKLRPFSRCFFFQTSAPEKPENKETKKKPRATCGLMILLDADFPTDAPAGDPMVTNCWELQSLAQPPRLSCCWFVKVPDHFGFLCPFFFWSLKTKTLFLLLPATQDSRFVT